MIRYDNMELPDKADYSKGGGNFMSSVIEKITLYDLLGYAIPGTVFIGLIGWACVMRWDIDFLEKYKDYTGYVIAVWLVLGYVFGIVISEIMSSFFELFIKDSGWFQKRSAIVGNDYKAIAKALVKAGLIQNKKEIQSMNDAMKYMTYMYSIIQSDPKYNRVHNYASLELLCKNMAFVFGVGSIAALWCIKECCILIVLLALFLISSFMFARRWRKVYWKKRSYTISWFVDKYVKN